MKYFKKSIGRYLLGLLLVVLMWIGETWALYTLVTLSLIGFELAMLLSNVIRHECDGKIRVCSDCKYYEK